MRSSTTASHYLRRISVVGFLACILLSAAAFGQRVAILTPNDTWASRTYATKLRGALAETKLVDDSLAKSAFEGVGVASPYNLSLEEAKRAGQAIGCDFFVPVSSGVRRQSSFEREEYYDAYAAVFLVSSRTGRLIDPRLVSEFADKPEHAFAKLEATIPTTAESLIKELRSTMKAELNEAPLPAVEEPPEEGSAAAKSFRSPVPFRRLKPEYTKLADRYEIAATVDMIVDLDADGHVLRTEITRWAGYDLDQSVDKAVRSMNWRPAERDGKFIPMRFLVRYNFKKVDKPAPQ